MINLSMRKFPSLVVYIFLLLQGNPLFSYEINPLDVTFVGEDRTTQIASIKKQNNLYVSIEDFIELFNLRYYTNDQNKKCVVRSGSHAIKIMGRNPFFMIDNRSYQLPLSPLVHEGQIFIPLKNFLKLASHVFPADIRFDLSDERLAIHRQLYNITGIQIEERANGNVIRFNTTQRFNEKDVAASFRRGWLNVTLFGGTLDSAKIATDQPVGMIKKIVAIQFETSAQVSFLLDREIKEKQFYMKDREVLLTLRNTQTIDEDVLASLETDRNRWIIDRIIIDPGHGGRDPGAVGPTGLKEKDVVLNISQRLKKLLEDNLNVEVLLTRDSDVYIPVKERGKFANKYDGKLFISIHCNGNNSSRVRGYSTWLLGPAKTQTALEMAEKENSVIELEDNTEAYKELQNAIHILNAMNQSVNLKESQVLAKLLNDEFKKINKFPQFGQGVFQAGFYVLVNAAMPKILVEAAHITNKYEERLLKTNAVRQQIAQALFESIKSFKSEYERGLR